MKQVLIATTLALACAASFAQTSTSITEPGKSPISAKAGANAEAKVEARKEAGTGTAMPTPAVPERGATPTSAKTAVAAEKNVEARKSAGNEAMKPMDANGDGMISRTEYNNYHASMWKKMKMTKGMVMQNDMQEMMKLGAASQ